MAWEGEVVQVYQRADDGLCCGEGTDGTPWCASHNPGLHRSPWSLSRTLPAGAPLLGGHHLHGNVGSHLPLLPTQARKHFRAPQVQQRFPPLRTTRQEGEKVQKEKISSKKKSEEIPCRFPPIEKKRTVAPQAEMAEPR